jgi:hypothetical protein
MFYFRFTENIENDINEGKSYRINENRELNGICAFSLNIDNPYANDSEVIEEFNRVVDNYVSNFFYAECANYGYAIIEGEYKGQGNDGVLISIDRVVKTGYLK